VIRILRAADRIAVPWKNGGGITREVAIWPEGSGFDNFDWRISIAEVREPGPFSVFENIDRVLTILEGCMALAFADRAVELDIRSAPFAFPGDVSCSGTPIKGAVTDLNVMTRRGRCAAMVSRITGEMMLPAARHLIVVALSDCDVRVGTESLTLRARDAILIENSTGQMSVGVSALMIALN